MRHSTAHLFTNWQYGGQAITPFIKPKEMTMKLTKKNDGNIGHNVGEVDKADVETTKHVRELEHKRTVLAEEIKDILNTHKKKYGTPKGSIRSAVKKLDMTKEQYQAKKEVEIQAQRIIELFVEKDGQLSFLSQNNEAAA
jgi:seryl-tRNA synthetase